MMKKIFSLTIILGLGTYFGLSSPGFAEDSISDLKAQIQALQQRVDELEAAQSQRSTVPSHAFPDHGWDPFAQMQRMQREMDELFSSAFNAPVPSPRGTFSTDMVFDQGLDLKETDKGYEVRFNMAGLNKEKTDIQINKHSITVSGQYSEEHKNEDQSGMMQMQRFGTFLKTIPLPVDADTGNVKTEQVGDELVITMPKK